MEDIGEIAEPVPAETSGQTAAAAIEAPVAVTEAGAGETQADAPVEAVEAVTKAAEPSPRGGTKEFDYPGDHPLAELWNGRNEEPSAFDAQSMTVDAEGARMETLLTADQGHHLLEKIQEAGPESQRAGGTAAPAERHELALDAGSADSLRDAVTEVRNPDNPLPYHVPPEGHSPDASLLLGALTYALLRHKINRDDASND